MNANPSGSDHPASFGARPLVWLYIAAGGLVLLGIGVAIDAYRHDHGASAAGVISRSSPGLLVAIAGALLAALGLLTALTLLAFHGAPSANSVARRAIGVTFAWVAVSVAAVTAVTYAVTSELTIGNVQSNLQTRRVAPVPTRSIAAPTAVPGLSERLTLTGVLTQDGAPLQADFLGAYVIRDGLVSACQVDIPRVDAGRYSIAVMADAESTGCGAPRGQILLWTFTNERFQYSRETLAWPGGASATFNASFSVIAPGGASAPFTSFKGHVVRSDGTRLPGGPLVEAFVGDTLCGRATVRREPEAWFTLLVAGPQVTGCTKDARITFRVDGAGAGEAGRNNLGEGASGLTIELTVQ